MLFAWQQRLELNICEMHVQWQGYNEGQIYTKNVCGGCYDLLQVMLLISEVRVKLCYLIAVFYFFAVVGKDSSSSRIVNSIVECMPQLEVAHFQTSRLAQSPSRC